MKIPVTDKFLWSLYNFIEDMDRIADFGIPRSMREGIDIWSVKQKHEEWRAIDRKQFSKTIYYLKKRGLIKIKNLENKKAIILTPQGSEKALKIKYKMMDKKKRKDGKWQMIIFDIPEKKRRLRDLLRENLNFLGYKMLQKSIWVCPYDVTKETEEFLRIHSLDSYVRLFLIEEL
ncbi:MAG: CRISPR-associated endoribonuclease Cas2 [Actinobacteria bacterium]|nr:CRISPR-associated endoribonuclease Cas2 [Actinomycetota bacterium]